MILSFAPHHEADAKAMSGLLTFKAQTVTALMVCPPSSVASMRKNAVFGEGRGTRNIGSEGGAVSLGHGTGGLK